MGWFAWVYITLIIVVFIVIFLIIFLTKDPNKKRSVSNSITLFLFAFMLFALVVTASYSSIASADTGGKNADTPNKNAHGYYTWATVLAWIAFALAIVGIIGLIYYRVNYAGTAAVVDATGKSQNKGGLVKFCLGAIVLLLLVIGILDAIGASQQQKSADKNGYRAGVIAATTAIILFVLTLAVLLSFTVKDNLDKKKKQKETKEAKQEELQILKEKENELLKQKSSSK